MVAPLLIPAAVAAAPAISAGTGAAIGGAGAALAGLTAFGKEVAPLVKEYGPQVAKAFIESEVGGKLIGRAGNFLANKAGQAANFFANKFGIGKKGRHTAKELLHGAQSVLASGPAQSLIQKQIGGLNSDVGKSAANLANKYVTQGLPKHESITPKELYKI